MNTFFLKILGSLIFLICTHFEVVIAQENELTGVTSKEEEHVCDDESRYQGNAQLEEYCRAANLSGKAADNNRFLWIAHAGIATLCGGACAANYICTAEYALLETTTATMKKACVANGTTCIKAKEAHGLQLKKTTKACKASEKLKMSCFGASVAGIVLDATKTNDIASAGAGMVGAITQGANLFDQKVDENPLVEGQHKAVSSGKQTTSQKVTACIPFVTETAAVFIKREAETGARESERENRVLAAELKNSRSISISRSSAAPTSSHLSSNPSRTGRNSSNPKGTEEPKNFCGSSDQPEEFRAKFQCAIATNHTLGPKVGNPDFLEGIENVAGTDFLSFAEAAHQSSPSRVIAAGLGRLGSPSEIANAVSEFAENFKPRVRDRQIASVYQSGGRSRPSKDESSEVFGKALLDLTQGLFGDSKQEENSSTQKTIEFQMSRSKNEIETDRNLSLFTRVSYRYQRSRKSLARVPWKSPYNREIAGRR